MIEQAGVERIIIVSRSSKPQEEAKRQLSTEFPDLTVETHQMPIENVEGITEVLKSTPIDVLVLNAYFTHQHHVPSSTLPTDDIQKTFFANAVMTHHMIATYIASSPTPSAGSKTVIAISSAGAHLQIPLQAAYGASKAAMSQIVTGFANEHSPQKDNIRLVSLHPGIILTEAAASSGYKKEDFVWEDINLPGNFAVWL
jgi:short-subunit dehydrogenase